MRVLVQMSKNDIHLLYSEIFINSFSRLHMPKIKSLKLTIDQMFKTFHGILSTSTFPLLTLLLKR